MRLQDLNPEADQEFALTHSQDIIDINTARDTWKWALEGAAARLS